MQLPIRIRLTRKCKRCGLRYPRNVTACTHCVRLSDSEVEDLKKTYAAYHVGNASLGRLFFFIAAVVIIIMIIVSQA
jgi:hypothetical protein